MQTILDIILAGLACYAVAVAALAAILTILYRVEHRRPARNHVPSAEYANAVVYGSRHARNDRRDAA